MYESSHVRRQLDNYRRQFRKLWYRPQAGLVVCRFGRIVGPDIFGESRLFEVLRRKILDFYALDRLHFAETRIYKSVTPQEVQDFVDRVVRAGIHSEGTPEIGRSIMRFQMPFGADASCVSMLSAAASLVSAAAFSMQSDASIPNPAAISIVDITRSSRSFWIRLRMFVSIRLHSESKADAKSSTFHE